MRSLITVCLALSLLILLSAVMAAPSLAASATGAQAPIARGVDLFETSTSAPTFVSFADDPIPAGFFCPGSAPFDGVVNLRGLPLATAPAGVAGNADTVVERLTDGHFVGGVADIEVVVRAMRLGSTDSIDVFCPNENANTRWRVSACLCDLQPTSRISARVDQACGCGHFNGTLRLNVCLRFTREDTGETIGPVQQNITLNIDNMPWCYQPGAGETVVSGPFAVDTDCDGRPDLTLPGSSNFHPGRNCTNQAANCWVVYAALTRCHSSYGQAPHDHCVNPVCGERPN